MRKIPLPHRPAIIRPRRPHINLLPRVLPHIVDIHRARPRLHGKGVRIAQPQRQIARLFPVAWLKNGLSAGMVPSELSRSIFPFTVASDWAFSGVAFSPTAAYSFPSLPK